MDRQAALTHFPATRWSLVRNGHVPGAQCDGNEALANFARSIGAPFSRSFTGEGIPPRMRRT